MWWLQEIFWIHSFLGVEKGMERNTPSMLSYYLYSAQEFQFSLNKWVLRYLKHALLFQKKMFEWIMDIDDCYSHKQWIYFQGISHIVKRHDHVSRKYSRRHMEFRTTTLCQIKFHYRLVSNSGTLFQWRQNCCINEKKNQNMKYHS